MTIVTLWKLPMGDLYDLMKDLHITGKLNNTVLILMSDHGARYGADRAELQGKQEERLPFFGFAFPSWFKSKYPEKYTNFRINTNRLTTPFDIHATFQSILRLGTDEERSVKQKGISLFEEVPKSRTCQHAKIPTHWCTCLNWHTVSHTDKKVYMAVEQVIQSINNHISSNEQCAILYLHNITRALQFLPDMDLVKFRRSADPDGLVPDMSDQTFVGTILYQVWFFTAPSMAYFEATVTFDIKSKTFSNNVNEISRLNTYGNDAACVYEGKSDIRRFCYCK